MPWKAEEKICPICGKIFITRSRGKFCSLECVGKWNSTRPRYAKEPSCAELRNLYIEQDKSLAFLIKHFGIPRTSMKRRLKRCRIASKYPVPTHFIDGKRMPSKRKYRVQHNGYALVLEPDHPKANKHGYVREHLFVWETHWRKALPEGFVIHHLNSIKDDNRIENLKAMPQGKHHSWLYIQALQKRIGDLETKLKERSP